MKNLCEIPVLALIIWALFSQKTMAQQTLIGSTDIPAYIQEVKPLPDNLSEAMRRTYGTEQFTYNPPQVESFYKPLMDKLEAVQNRYQDFYAKKQQSASYTEDQAKADINKNPIIANMGGLDAVTAMNEEERKVAATKATAQVTADPFAASGVQSAGMTALYQKIVADPAYAERFNKMSEKEKEAELRKYMANDQPVAKTPDQMKAHHEQVKQQNAQADKVRNAQEIQLKMQAWSEQIQAASDAFAQNIAAIEKQPGSHDDIRASFIPKYEAVPIVELGEYGHDKDPEMMQKLRQEEALAHKLRAEAELKQSLVPFKKLQADYVKIAADYMIWIKANAGKVNGDMNDFFNGTHTEIPLSGFEMSLLNMAVNLVDQSEEYAAAAAQWERRYLELIKE